MSSTEEYQQSNFWDKVNYTMHTEKLTLLECIEKYHLTDKQIKDLKNLCKKKEQ